MLAPGGIDDRPRQRSAVAAPGHLVTAQRLARREIAEKLGSNWFAVILTLTFLGAYAYGSMFQRSFETESVLVSRDPLLLLNAGLAGALGLVLGLRLSSSIAWEREHRTLEVLLVGPVAWPSLIAAKFVSELSILVLAAAAYLLYLLVAQPMGAGVIRLSDAASSLLMLLLAVPFLGLGLLVSSLCRTVRVAAVGYIVLILVFAAFDAAHEVLVSTPPESLSLVSLYARAAAEAASPFIDFVSPTSAVTSGARTLAGASGGMAAVVAHATGLSIAMVGLAMAIGRKLGTGR